VFRVHQGGRDSGCKRRYPAGVVGHGLLAPFACGGVTVATVSRMGAGAYLSPPRPAAATVRGARALLVSSEPVRMLGAGGAGGVFLAALAAGG
jgi:hypothetical protein